MSLRVGEPLLLTKSLGDAANGADVVIDKWTTTDTWSLQRELQAALQSQLPDHDTRLVAWGNPTGKSVFQLAKDMLAVVFQDESCRDPGNIRGDHIIPVVSTTQRGLKKRGEPVVDTISGQRMFPSVWVEIEREPAGNVPARVVAMRVGFPTAPSCVRLSKQVLSMSIAPGAGRIVAHVKAHGTLLAEDRGNPLAHVALTRTSCLGDLALTRESVVTREMFAPTHELEQLVNWTAQQEGWSLEYKYTPRPDGTAPDGDGAGNEELDGEQQMFDGVLAID